MILVLALAALIWGAGTLAGMPSGLRWALIAGLLLVVIAAQLALPDEHPLTAATGDARGWVLLLLLGTVTAAYRWGLGQLRQRARPQPVAQPETDLSRYARHIMLREIGGPGQKRLSEARVLVVGAGGLGSPALLYLAAAGVGTIGVIDDDTVDMSNLQRQIIHGDADIGRPKVQSAADAIARIAPAISVRTYNRRLDASATDLMSDYDLVLDGTDGFDSRYLINRACCAAGVPLISGALSQWEGQISLFDPARGGPCYECVFPTAPADGLAPSCAEAGVLGPLPGVIGAMMAAEAVKHLTGAGETLRGRMLIYDALYAETRSMGLKPRAGCPACGHSITSPS